MQSRSWTITRTTDGRSTSSLSDRDALIALYSVMYGVDPFDEHHETEVDVLDVQPTGQGALARAA